MSVLFYVFVSVVVLLVSSIIFYRRNNIYSITEQNTKENILFFANEKVPKIKILMITIMLATFSAYIGVSGRLVDTTRYAWSFLNRYPQYYESFSTIINSRVEPGFLVINMVVIQFTDNPFWLFFLIAMGTTFINIYCMFKLNKRYLVVIFIYLISIYYFQTTYLLGQTIAVSFANLAFVSMRNNKKMMYFIYSLIGLAFHSTAIILFPVFFLYNRKDYKKIFAFIVLVSLTVFVLFDPILNSVLPKLPYINRFLDIESMGLTLGGGSITSILKGMPYYIITILSFYKSKKLRKNINGADIFILFSLLYSLSWIFTYNFYWAFRIGWYFLMPTIVLFPDLIKSIKSNNYKILFAFIICSVMLAITFRQIIITLL